MAGIKWSRADLDGFRRSLRGLKLGAHLPRIAQLIAAGGVKLTMDTFRSQRDPYGRPWQPLARERTRDRQARKRALARGKKPRGQKILINTARMRNSTAPIRGGRMGGVGIPTGYAIVHQKGATLPARTRTRGLEQTQRARQQGTPARGGRIPQRMMLPDSALGLPAHWQRMIQRETLGLLTRWLAKGARG